MRLPSPIEVQVFAHAPGAIADAQGELRTHDLGRTTRPLTADEIAELRKIRRRALRPSHWIAASICLLAHVLVMKVVSTWLLPSTLYAFVPAAATLAGCLLVIFWVPISRRSTASRALAAPVVTAITPHIAGKHVEFLPGLKIAWTEGGHPSRWRIN